MQRQQEAAGEDFDRFVAAYLRANPGWLAAHPDLYAVLDPPRRLHGEAFADHMAAMLEQARRHGTGAAAGRRAADGFTQRVQDAVVALMRATDAVWCLHHDLPGLLRIESVHLCAEIEFEGARPVPAGTIDAQLGQRCAVVREAARDALLHGEAAPLARQEALLRVPLAAGPALLALASRDADGLEGAGTQALAFLGQAAAAALERG
ncbi:MAG: hypothetical protein JOZ05_21425 [Acetobacteraceae bacterium]|nr:hypothetical protein [Acetobacteraceae bacterium]